MAEIDGVAVRKSVTVCVSVFFFFSSRRRHTRCLSDWSSDVCSSDLFVSVARSNLINVYDVTSHALVKSIPVIGENPRALAVSADGSKVYAAFALSGNHTTIVPAQYAPPPPPPTNPQLPPPPQVGAIVDASDPHWSSVIRYSMPDNGVVAIDTTSLTVTTYYSYVGTTHLGLAVQPGTGDLWVSNTHAINLLMRSDLR